MLSMDIIKSTAKAVTYFEVDDYYTKGTDNPEAVGTWYGRGATALGLEGAVDPEHFKLMLEGHLPNGETLGSESEEETKHTPGWDLTFSAPKSVSIVAEVGRDERVFEAHNKAVAEALRWIEDHALGTRVRSPLGRLFLGTKSLVAALFTHHTSRNQDPDLHTHAVVMNAVQREDGRWASVHSHPLFKHKMAAGIVYRAALARELQILGYEIEVTHRDGRFKIVGVPEDIEQGLSTRSVEIRGKMKKMGVEDAEGAAKANLATRRRKKHVERGELISRWRDFVEQKGFDVDSLVAAARAAGPRTPEEGIGFEVALKDAIDLLSERQAVFDHFAVVRFTQALLMGRADVAQVEELIKGAERDGRLRRVDEAGLERWTTPRAQEQERRIIKMMLKGRNSRDPIATTAEVERALKDLPMNDKQRAAATKLLTTRDQYSLVVGLPGVGKTTYMLKYVHDVGVANGKRFVGMAQNANVAGKLEEDTGMPSSTIHSHFAKLGKDLAALRQGGAYAQMIRDKYRDEVWIVDEGSQLPNELKRRLMTAAKKLEVQMAIVGDHRQIGAIDAGDPFNLMRTRGAEVSEITEILRTKDAKHKKAIVEVRDGKISEGLKTLKHVTEEIEDEGARIKEMLWLYKELGDKRSDALFVTARNHEKVLLNDGARKILLDEGKLKNDTPREKLVSVPSGTAELRDARFYERGYVVLFGQDLPNGVKEDEYWQVMDIDKKTNTVMLGKTNQEVGSTVAWNPREIGTAGRQGAEVYKLAKTSLAEGDLIRWSKNIKIGDEEMFNGQMLRVVKIEGDNTTFAGDGGREITINQRELSGAHWGHAYASTVYSSQGRSVPIVIVNAESNRKELLSQKAFLVAISRQRETLFLFTDDAKELEKSLLNFSGEKSTATEAVERSQAISAWDLAKKLFADWVEPAPPSRSPPSRSIGA